MPPLRERRPDIPLLANHFLQKRSAAATRKIAGISEQAAACLMAYDWPGNVRELENAMERAIVLGTTDQIMSEDLPDSISESGSAANPEGAAKFHNTIRNWKRELVLKALAESHNNYSVAARNLGIHPNNLYRLLKTLNLTSER
jgi:DNA-binding NtrC family response regulator